MQNSKGFTLIETLIVLLMLGVMIAIVAPNIRFGINSLDDTTNRLAANFKLVRARAMGQTSAYQIKITSATQLAVERAKKCSDTSGWIGEPSFTDEDMGLKEAQDVKGMAQHDDIQIVTAEANGAAITPLTNWKICFTSRGMADKNVKLTLKNTKTNQTRRVEVFSGGGVQIYDN